MLQVNNIEVVYKNVIQVLRGVSLEVGDGRIIALLGANGGGKTTTLKAISGLLKTEEGEVTGGGIDFDGRRIVQLLSKCLFHKHDLIRFTASRILSTLLA